jgi:AraC-like DNA-binding protein
MDALSQVLSLVKPQSYAATAFDFGTTWSVPFSVHEGIKCIAVLTGEGWLFMEGETAPVFASAGDCILLPRGLPFTVVSDPDLRPVSAEALQAASPEATTTTRNGGVHTTGFAAHFTLAQPHAGVLADELPPILHITKESQKATLRWCLESMMQELLEPEPGSSMFLQQLAGMVLIQALRHYLAQEARGRVSWLFALTNPSIAGAIQAMHDNPARRWTLQSLAQQVGMSRTIFTLKFRDTVGQSPMEYLSRWRMLIAADRLTASSVSLSVVANELGYESESAFSTAFKRVMGCPPRQYRTEQTAQQGMRY